MTNSKSTKRALVTSALAILMCVAMLIGTTFAWFTDTASTGVNKIQAGNLKVGFQYWDGSKYVDAKNVSLFSDETLWEPGHAEVVYLKVINQGSLALKYKLNTFDTWEWKTAKNSDGETILLSKYLQIGVVKNKNAANGTYGDRQEAVAAAAGNLVSYDSYTEYNTLLPAEKGSESADYLAFVVYMPTTVGNEANSVNGNKPAIRFNLALNATQVDHEEDSFGTDYDKNVPYPVAGADANGTGAMITNELSNKNPSILLGADANNFYGWSVSYATTINTNGNAMTTTGSNSVINVNGSDADLTITGNGSVDASKGSDNVIAVKALNNSKLTIEGGTFNGGQGGSNICVAAVNGATVTIKGGTFTVGADADGNGNSVIYSQGGNITIEGGFFYTDTAYEGKYYVLNQKNDNPGTIVVKGGTFVNYNPAGGDDYVQPTNFVAPGYKVVSEVHGSDTWYTVVAE